MAMVTDHTLSSLFPSSLATNVTKSLWLYRSNRFYTFKCTFIYAVRTAGGCTAWLTSLPNIIASGVELFLLGFILGRRANSLLFLALL